MRLWKLTTAVLMILTGLFAARAAQADLCAQGTLLAPGLWARINGETFNNLRAEPGLSAARIGRIPPGDIFTVLDGPVCTDGYRWWQVDYAGALGWTAEANLVAGAVWVAPLDGQRIDDEPADDDLPGCRRPPEDYTRIIVGGVVLNLRTLAMLDHAQAIYSAGGGFLRFRSALVQGSYNVGGVSASFGTHDGGGAVDLSVRDAQTRQVLEREIGPMLDALRTAGFAAWLRDTDQLYPGSPIHIHAIAIGDADLSPAARAQIDGEYGYLRGFNGLPPDWGGPARDDRPAVLCAWMRDPSLRLRIELGRQTDS